MHYVNKALSVDEAIAHVYSGSRPVPGEFVGAGKPACHIEVLLASGIGQLTLITNTPGLRGGFLKARLFSSGQLAELISTYVGTTDESTQAYLTDPVCVAEFFPMGTWAEKVRAGAPSLSDTLVSVGMGILDQPGMFLKRGAPRQTLTVDGTTYFVEPPLRVDVSVIKGWCAGTLDNVGFHGTALQDQRDIAMTGDYTIVKVNEIVEVGTIPPEHVGCPGVLVNAVVQRLSLDGQHALYKYYWTKLGHLSTAEA